MTVGWDKDGDRDVNKGGDGPGIETEHGLGQGYSGGLCQGS